MDGWHMNAWRMNDECCMNEKHGCKNSWKNGKFDETQINVWWISNEWTPWMMMNGCNYGIRNGWN
jgi:hypothetical protein